MYSSDLSYLALPGKRRSRRDRIAGLPSRLGEIASGSDDSSDDSIPEETAFAIAEPARQGAVELQRHLEADPTDIDGWIRLSKLEGAAPSDSMARQNSNTGVATSRRAQSEIAHTVLSRAIAAAPANQASIRLEMEYMRHAEVIWPSAKVTARWKYLLEQEDRWTDDRAYMDIWLGYIAWMEGRGLDTKQEADSSDTTSNQGVDGVIALYVDCIRVMRKLALKRYPGKPSSLATRVQAFNDFLPCRRGRRGEPGVSCTARLPLYPPCRICGTRPRHHASYAATVGPCSPYTGKVETDIVATETLRFQVCGRLSLHRMTSREKIMRRCDCRSLRPLGTKKSRGLAMGTLAARQRPLRVVLPRPVKR